jgi:hypothetical protein
MRQATICKTMIKFNTGLPGTAVAMIIAGCCQSEEICSGQLQITFADRAENRRVLVKSNTGASCHRSGQRHCPKRSGWLLPCQGSCFGYGSGRRKQSDNFKSPRSIARSFLKIPRRPLRAIQVHMGVVRIDRLTGVERR